MAETLAEAFEAIAQREIYIQNNERDAEKCLEHARPLLAVIEKIEAAARPAGAGEAFYVSGNKPGRLANQGTISIDIGLVYVHKDERKWVKIQEDKDVFTKGPVKAAAFLINLDGSADVVRYDKATPDSNAVYGYNIPITHVAKVTDILPMLASWVQDNLPEALEALIPKPRTGGGRGLCVKL